jgi:ABC-type dipeptide/oligopeptide/nickel transport system ATPase component
MYSSRGLPVVAQLATLIAVMRAGQFVESGPAERILRDPTSPYTVSFSPRFPRYPAPPRCDIFPAGPA